MVYVVVKLSTVYDLEIVHMHVMLVSAGVGVCWCWCLLVLLVPVVRVAGRRVSIRGPEQNDKTLSSLVSSMVTEAVVSAQCERCLQNHGCICFVPANDKPRCSLSLSVFNLGGAMAPNRYRSEPRQCDSQ